MTESNHHDEARFERIENETAADKWTPVFSPWRHEPEDYRDITRADPTPAEPPAPCDHSANPWGASIAEEAKDPQQSLALFHAGVVGAFSAATTLEQFLSIQANYERAMAIRTAREEAR